MKINVTCGFFLPVPPLAGGSTEKSWHRLATLLAARGHEVAVLSRRWPGLPDAEVRDGVRHFRLPGWSHRRSLWQNLLLDFLWSWKVHRALPPADVTVVNNVALPVWLARLKPAAGRVVVMTGRMPKGQYRHYRGVSRVLAASRHVLAQVRGENPALAARGQVVGYPIDWTAFSAPRPPRDPGEPVVLGYIGRLHQEKGLRLLAEAAGLLARDPQLPPWRLRLLGPHEVAQGGGGVAFVEHLRQRLSLGLAPGQCSIEGPRFDEDSLRQAYRELDVFCYPSIAERGETFGVAALEAMAAGAVPVVSGLACFSDFLRAGENGLSFDHNAPDAAAQLAGVLRSLVLDTALRHRFAAAAQATARHYDYPAFADRMLADFAALADG